MKSRSDVHLSSDLWKVLRLKARFSRKKIVSLSFFRLELFRFVCKWIIQNLSAWKECVRMLYTKELCDPVKITGVAIFVFV